MCSTPCCFLSPALQYGNGDFAPGIAYGDYGKWTCGHNLLLAHGYAVKLYRDYYNKDKNGRIGMALWSEWSEPWTDKFEGGCELDHCIEHCPSSHSKAAIGIAPLRSGNTMEHCSIVQATKALQPGLLQAVSIILGDTAGSRCKPLNSMQCSCITV